MEVLIKDFPDTLSDNEDYYFRTFVSAMEAVDEFCNIQIEKSKTGYNFRISPSVPKYTEPLIKEITKFHNTLNIRVDFSKSIKTTGTIFFKIKTL